MTNKAFKLILIFLITTFILSCGKKGPPTLKDLPDKKSISKTNNEQQGTSNK